MKKETIFLSLTALLIGLLVAGGAFYAFQLTTKPKPEKQKTIVLEPTPTPVSSNTEQLMISTPQDEEVTDTKTVKISGKTLPGSTVVVTSENDEQVADPADNGDFSLTTTIGDGVNLIQVVSILPSGEEKKVVRSITYSTESF